MGGVNSAAKGCFGDFSDSDGSPTSQDTVETRRNSRAQDPKTKSMCQLDDEYNVKRRQIMASGSVMSRLNP